MWKGVAIGFGIMNDQPHIIIGERYVWGNNLPFGISALDQRQHRPSVRRRDVERDASFPTVEPRKVCRFPAHHPVVRSRRVADTRAFNLYDIRAHVGQLARAERPGHCLFQRHNSQSGEREGQNDLGISNTCSPMYDRMRLVDTGAT